jgi:hypothetical protein
LLADRQKCLGLLVQLEGVLLGDGTGDQRYIPRGLLDRLRELGGFASDLDAIPDAETKVRG